MSSAVITSLLAANQKIVAYVGISILIIGIFGGILNTIVFLSLKTFRESSCAFYLTVLSIVNIGQLITGLLSRVMITGFGIDWTQMSVFYCKFRTFAFQVTSMISLTCICLATIDQYLATCTRRRWQQWSNIKIAHCMIIITILMALIVQIPCIIFYDHVKSSLTDTISCTATNNGFVTFNAYVTYLIIGSILPTVITLVFGLMAYHNIQEIAYRTMPLVRRELDKQLTNMVLVQVVYTFFSIFPNAVMYIILCYGNIQDSVIIERLHLVYAVTTCIYYSYFAVSVSLFSIRFVFNYSLFYLESILYLCMCIREISSATALCTLQSSFNSM
jgi:hypothetical protein